MPSILIFILVFSLRTLSVFLFCSIVWASHVASSTVRLHFFYEVFSFVSSIVLQSFDNGRYQPALHWWFYRARLFRSFSWKFPLRRWSHFFRAYSYSLCGLGCAAQAIAFAIASFARQTRASERIKSPKSTDSLPTQGTPLGGEVGFCPPVLEIVREI